MSNALQVYADALVKRYIVLLNLYEWDICIKVQNEETYCKKHGKRFGNATNGCTDIFQSKKKAKIYIKDSLDEETFRNCIIHELVHIPINDLYVTGLTAFQEMQECELKTETLFNWEWILEAAVCRITHGYQRLEEEVERHAEMLALREDTSE